MACEGCRYPHHEQFAGYTGRWICFRPGRTCGKTICNTPVKEWGDFRANNKRLAEAKTPGWCPGPVVRAVENCK